MSIVKDYKVNFIKSYTAREFIKKWHYSKKVTMNSQIHFGAYKENTLIGVLQYGPSTDKRRMAQNLNLGVNDFLELNRMALINSAPKNAESRIIGITIKMIKRHYPNIKAILSFADACQCGDGTIYRAANFKLLDIKINNSLLVSPDGNKIISDKTLNDHIINGKRGTSYYKNVLGYKPLKGFQFKYIYFIDKSLEKNYKLIAFNDIPKECRMYLGTKRP